MLMNDFFLFLFLHEKKIMSCKFQLSMDDDKTSEYICNPVTGKNVLKSSVLGKIILKCEKEFQKRRTYLIHYQTGDVNPLNSFFVWTLIYFHGKKVM